MSDRVSRHRLQVAPELDRFLTDEALPGRSQTASQVAFYNNQRERQRGAGERAVGGAGRDRTDE